MEKEYREDLPFREETWWQEEETPTPSWSEQDQAELSDEEPTCPEDNWEEEELEEPPEEDLDSWDDMAEASEEEANKIAVEEPEEQELTSTGKSWDQVKRELNQWGYLLSAGDMSEQLAATDIICRIFDKLTVRYDSFRENEESAYAYSVLRDQYAGSPDVPIRYLKGIYPETAFHDALYITLGLSYKERGEGMRAGKYDHTKGAAFVSYFNTRLKFALLSYRKKLGKHKHYSEEQLQMLEAPEEDNADEAQVDVLVNLSKMTSEALHYAQKLPVKADESKGIEKDTTTTSEILQMFYTLQLVNFSRFIRCRVTAQEDRNLMDGANTGFVAFSTTVQENEMGFGPLQRASLSSYIMENRLYKLLRERQILKDAAVADYLGKTHANISKHFKHVRRYLNEYLRPYL